MFATCQNLECAATGIATELTFLENLPDDVPTPDTAFCGLCGAQMLMGDHGAPADLEAAP